MCYCHYYSIRKIVKIDRHSVTVISRLIDTIISAIDTVILSDVLDGLQVLVSSSSIISGFKQMVVTNILESRIMKFSNKIQPDASFSLNYRHLFTDKSVLVSSSSYAILAF